MLLLEHSRDVLVLVREHADQLLVLRGQAVQQSLVEDADQLIPVFLQLFRAFLDPVHFQLPIPEALRVVHDLADLEELCAVDPYSQKTYLSDWLFLTCT